MDLLSRGGVVQNICGIEIDASALILPAADGALQPFSNTYVSTSNAKAVNFGRGSVRLQQSGKPTRAGMLYKQSLTITFLNADPLSSERIQEYIKVKFIYIKLSEGMVYFFGRNDYLQNAALKVSIKSNDKKTQIQYSTSSIFPLGLTNGSNEHLLPEDLPINFFNL